MEIYVSIIFPNGFHSWHAVLHCISRVKVSVSELPERESLHVDHACASDRTYCCWSLISFFFQAKAYNYITVTPMEDGMKELEYEGNGQNIKISCCCILWNSV